MRKPRDIDAELRALADKAKGLKARKISQLGSWSRRLERTVLKSKCWRVRL